MCLHSDLPLSPRKCRYDSYPPFGLVFAENINGIVVKIASDCGNNFTYVVNGGYDDWSAPGDWHDPAYEHMAQVYKFFWKEHPRGTSRHCHFDLHVYPSDEFHEIYERDEPLIYAGVVLLVFLFTGIVFFGYDIVVGRKQKRVKSQAQRAEDIVTSVFPREVGLRLIHEAEERAAAKTGGSPTDGG